MNASDEKITRREALRTAAAAGAAAAFAAHGLPVAAAATDGESVSAACRQDWTPTFPAAKKYDPPVQISTIFSTDQVRFVHHDTWINNAMSRRVKDHLGIEYTVHWQASGDVATQKMQTDIASHNLADMFQESDVLLSQLIQYGAVEEIKDIWEATASPLVKQKKLYPHGKNWIPVQRGNKLYGVAFSYGPGYNVDNLGWIRKDMLDKVHLPIPQTLDQLTTALKAFKAKGLTKFGINACMNLATWYNSLDPVFGAFGVMPTIWRPTPHGTLEYGSLQPGVKDALAFLHGWYAAGLLDPDYYTYHEGDAAVDVSAGKVGAFFGPWWAVSTDVGPMESKGARFVIFPAPKGPHGQRGRLASPVAGPAVVFRTGLEHRKIEAALTQLNWQMEMHVNWQKYHQYGEERNSAGFFEGYEWVFGKNCTLQPGPVYDPNTYAYVDGVGFAFPNLCYPDYQTDIFKDMKKWYVQAPHTLNMAQRFLMSDPIVKREIDAYLLVVDTRNIAIENGYLGAPTPAMTKVLPDLQTLESQYFNQIVTGRKPVKEFDTFVAYWRARGGDQVTKDVNAWYATMKQG